MLEDDVETKISKVWWQVSEQIWSQITDNTRQKIKISSREIRHIKRRTVWQFLECAKW
jgi:hypothetical protein